MRINIIGGAGIGKSTVAAILFGELKKRNYSIELVNEYVKSWAIQNKKINLFDQNYIFGKQQQYEYRYLINGIKNIITDSPIALSSVYAEFYFGKRYSQHFLIAEDLYEEEYPSINILLNRDGNNYIQEARFENLKTAKKIDKLIKEKLDKKKRNYKCFDRDKISDIIKYIEQNIDK